MPRGKAIAAGIAGRAPAGRSAGLRERQAQQPGHLVVGLARRVVDRSAELDHVLAPDARDKEQGRVAARDEQRDAGLLEWAVTEQIHRDMRRQVVDGVERLVEGEGVRLGRGHPDEQRAGELRAGRDRHRVDVTRRQARGRERPVGRRDQRLQVRPAGDLGHDPAEPGVLVNTARHRIGQECPAPNEANPSLVARGLDAQDQRLGAGDRITVVLFAGHRGSSLRMTTASTRPAS